MNGYDVIIVGAGPSGVFCAYKLVERYKNKRILIIEKGRSIEKRVCPKRKEGRCINCNPCNITTGFSGAGAFSDGKLTLASRETGGNLSELIGEDVVKELIEETDSIYLKFGADNKLYGFNDESTIREIRRKAIQANMQLIESPIRHLGTEASYEIYSKLQKYLIDKGVEFKFETMVKDIIVEKQTITGVVTTDGKSFLAPKIIIGAGREGSAWFKGVCDKHKIKTEPGVVDIGVRVECRDEIMEELNKLYESKLVYITETYSDKVRTFCQNPSGEVALENYTLPNGQHIVTVNGHAYKDKKLKTNNTNFALLVSRHFTEPFTEPLEYGAIYAKAANLLAGGGVLRQSYGDIKKNRRSKPIKDRRNVVSNLKPTLPEAVPGDLMSVLPARIATDIIEMIEAMDKIVPGIASNETLLYGIEVKFYSNKVLVNDKCETNIKGLYAIGDSSSWTRGLCLASSMGLYVAKQIEL